MSEAKKSRGRSRSALLFISLILLGSGLVRLTDGTGLAIAREVESLSNAVSTKSVPLQCEPEPEIAAMLAAILEREARADTQEQDIKERLAMLTTLEREVKTQLTVLEDAEEKLRKTIALADDAAENDIARLTTVYENMKPKDAAVLFEQMAPEFAAGFLARMRPESAAEVMAGLTPEKGYALSVILASRNAAVPKE